MSKASVDLPEPLTPVMTLNLPRGMSTDRCLRLCSRALTISMASRPGAGATAYWAGFSRTASAAGPSAVSYAASAAPVCEPFISRTCSGVPTATTWPPPSPPSGPRSITQSLARITSRLCSITTSEWPASSSLRSARIRRAMSSKCRPVVGSSKRKSVPFFASG